MDEESIFLRAVEIENPDAQVSFLDEACGDDRLLRASVDSLLAHHKAAGHFLEAPPAELQHTFAPCDADTVECGSIDGLLQLLAPCDKPGCIGQLGPYEVIEVIGRGGMGVVLRARDTKLNRDVAIKALLAAGSPGPRAVKRFLREAQASAAVKHDHVVTIHAIHDECRLPFIVMEYIEGISLQERIERDGALEVDEIRRIGAQIAAGLDAAHRRGLVHRDIKPANILLEPGTDRAKITDFGLAHSLQDGTVSCEGQIAGTLQFMSPEQAQGRRADHRSDLFSLGGVLYSMCTGRPAFSAETAVAALRGICDDAPTPIHEINKAVPPWLEQLIWRLLEKHPDKRPQSAREVADLLDQRLGALQASARLATPGIEVSRSVARRLKKGTLITVVGVAAVALASVIIILNRNGKRTRIEAPEGATVKVTNSGEIEVDLPDNGPTHQLSLAKRPVPQTVKDVAARLVQRNPGFDGELNPTLSNDQIIGLTLNGDQITDISPIRSLTALRSLDCRGSTRESGQLADLSALRGMTLFRLDCSNTPVADLAPLENMPLQRLNCANTNVSDLAPLKAMPLSELYIQGANVTDLSPLRGMPLRHLNVSFTRVTDLSPLKDMRLIALYCDGTHVVDLSPLATMPLTTLHWRDYDQASVRHQKVVRSISTLELIDSLPASEFWRAVDAKRKD